jgi:hypothetical protein
MAAGVGVSGMLRQTLAERPGMRVRKLLCFVGLSLLPAMTAAADYSGSYDNPQLSLTLTAGNDGYAGELHLGNQKFPVTAHEDSDQLTGAFTSAGNSFPFTGSLHGDDLTLVSGGRTYALHRQANPLGAGAPAVQAVPAAPLEDPLAKYAVLNSTDSGRSLLRELPDAKSTTGVLRVVFPDLARSFGVRPTISGSYEDGRDHKSVYVSFNVQIQGQAYKGFVTVKLRDSGAVAFVVYGKQNATRAEWAALTARPDVKTSDVKTAPDTGAPKERDMKAEMAAVPLKTYALPDGTCSIGLARGWTTQSQTESNLLLTGPADQKVRMAMNGVVYVPNSPMIIRGKTTAFNQAVGPNADNAADVLINLTKATNTLSVRHGGPAVELDKIEKVTDIKSQNPGGHAAQIVYDITVTTHGESKKYGVLIQFDASAVRNGGTWGYYIPLQLIAPKETFEKDLPVMMAQAFSLSENAAVIGAKSRREIDAAQRQAESQREANDRVAQANYDHTRAVEDASAAQSKHWADIDNDETKRQRTATDFDETIRGIRTVEDTQTGEKTSVDLGNVHDIVDKLNEQDPGRYKEIPLRDEVYPLPGHENDPDYLQR